jgi:hypothetical protein
MAAAMEASAIAQRVVSAVLDESTPAKDAGALALRLIDATDPLVEATFSLELPSTVEEVEKLSLRELEALADAYQIPAPEHF